MTPALAVLVTLLATTLAWPAAATAGASGDHPPQPSTCEQKHLLLLSACLRSIEETGTLPATCRWALSALSLYSSNACLRHLVNASLSSQADADSPPVQPPSSPEPGTWTSRVVVLYVAVLFMFGAVAVYLKIHRGLVWRWLWDLVLTGVGLCVEIFHRIRGRGLEGSADDDPLLQAY